jgi:TnpA family transposase
MSDQNTTQTTLPSNVEVIERLEDADKAALDLVKAKRETAISNAKLAESQKETAELVYNNLVLRLALKYHLSDGDILSEDGAITRKS